MVLEIIYDLLVGCLLVFVIGFFSSKFSLWGGLGIVVASLAYLLIPGYDAADPVRLMAPKLVDIWMIYPRAAVGSIGDAEAAFGALGFVAAGIVLLILVIPYATGVWLGLTRYPEILAFRVVL